MMKWLILLLKELRKGIWNLSNGKPTSEPASKTFSYRLLIIVACISFGLGGLLGWRLTSRSSKKTYVLPDTAWHATDNYYQQKADSLTFQLRQKDETIIDLREQMALDSVRRMSELEAMRTINERYRRR